MNIFISYSSIDKQYAFELLRLLEQQEGCDAWLDFIDIKPSEVLKRELSENLEKADLICLLLSPYSAASKWVLYETEYALKRKIKLLPIILRPCVIPEILSNIVGIDVSAGITEESTELRIIRTVMGKESIDENVLLNAGKQLEYAKLALQNEADKHLPAVTEMLEAIQKIPIQEISFTIAEDTFPKDKHTIIELQLQLNALWTEPMSFYFAIYREGSTWPSDFGFKEPSYKVYFKEFRSKIDCKFKWLDRTTELRQTIDGTDFHNVPATFNMEFSGEKFHPKSSGIHVEQDFQIPSLFDLSKDNCHFKLIAHHTSDETAHYIDTSNTDLDLTVTAHFKDTETPHLKLFKSRHSQQELEILGCQYLTICNNEIEKEVLLGLCPVNTSHAKDNSRKYRIKECIEKDETIPEEDNVPAANYCYSKAQLFAFRNDHYNALKFFHKTVMLLEKNIMENYPPYSEALLAYQGAENLLGYYMQQKKYERAKDFMNAPYMIALRLIELYPDEPDYQRLWANALLRIAIISNETEDKKQAASFLKESVDTWRILYDQLKSPERYRDYKEAIVQAIDFSKSWDIESRIPLDTWWHDIDEDGSIKEKIISLNKTKEQNIPEWLNPPLGKTWQTRFYESPLLRYTIHIPDFYSDKPEFLATDMETKHIFYGQSRNTETLIISFMDKATGGDMKVWVETMMSIVGFPVLELSGKDENTKPKLQEWIYEGRFPELETRLELDEAHAYSGFAFMPSINQNEAPLGARIYILLARRNNFAWNVTLSFTSAVFPGMPANMVYSNDHVRAAAVFENIKFG